jgi:hypothetical protein
LEIEQWTLFPILTTPLVTQFVLYWARVVWWMITTLDDNKRVIHFPKHYYTTFFIITTEILGMDTTNPPDTQWRHWFHPRFVQTKEENAKTWKMENGGAPQSDGNFEMYLLLYAKQQSNWNSVTINPKISVPKKVKYSFSKRTYSGIRENKSLASRRLLKRLSIENGAYKYK